MHIETPGNLGTSTDLKLVCPFVEHVSKVHDLNQDTREEIQMIWTICYGYVSHGINSCHKMSMSLNYCRSSHNAQNPTSTWWKTRIRRWETKSRRIERRNIKGRKHGRTTPPWTVLNTTYDPTMLSYKARTNNINTHYHSKRLQDNLL